MRNAPALVTVLSLVSATALFAIAADAPKVPSSVLQTIKSVAGDSKTTEISVSTEDGKTVYDVEFTLKGGNYALDIDANGNILQREVEVDATMVPSAVTAAATKAHSDGKIEEYAVVTKGDQMYYGVDVKVGKDMHELDILANGTILSDAVEAPETSIPTK